MKKVIRNYKKKNKTNKNEDKKPGKVRIRISKIYISMQNKFK